MLKRDFLQKADCKTAFGIIDESLLLTPEQRRASLACMLRRRPDNSPVWVFGYGALMWNPIFEAEEVRPATLAGWHHAFCLRLISGRGTTAQPGRMLALKEGGQTTGLAFRLPEARLHEELEMLTGCYIPTWSELTLDSRDSVTTLVFVMDPCHQRQYLFALEQELNNYGMQNECMVELVKQVRRLIQGRAAVNQTPRDEPPLAV
ncbi:cation transport regulator ChaC [Sodalis glossinidius str. 'morsitans']|uniref:glutathione-specific gamma-glutamylcyclotransferase n=1 Tax=Sodalis glossinidius (strain morsitans) TaxID=343509 RepID=Q2NRS9_SODGM|nr:gamma-glutamylcyclotransferase [Sodalis glossinidius]BAE75146.1 cation transport regulator ChaC [Sodalis glossinidius str. 'morsitans']